jgi:hypothetical protein
MPTVAAVLEFPSRKAVWSNYSSCPLVVRQIVVSLHLEDFFLFGASSSVWDCRLIRRPAKDARRRHEPSSAGLHAKTFCHQKMALESTLPPHNDGVARRVSERIESSFHTQSEFQ